MLKVNIPKTKERLIQQIEALEYAITQDTREKDRRIHESVLELFKKELRRYDADDHNSIQ
jgi:hypothetical protein